MLLSGCASTPPPQNLIVHKYLPININRAEYPCPYTPTSELPNPETVTEVGLIKLLASSRHDNKICYNSIYTVFQVIEDFNKKVEENNATK